MFFFRNKRIVIYCLCAMLTGCNSSLPTSSEMSGSPFAETHYSTITEDSSTTSKPTVTIIESSSAISNDTSSVSDELSKVEEDAKFDSIVRQWVESDLIKNLNAAIGTVGAQEAAMLESKLSSLYFNDPPTEFDDISSQSGEAWLLAHLIWYAPNKIKDPIKENIELYEKMMHTDALQVYVAFSDVLSTAQKIYGDNFQVSPVNTEEYRYSEVLEYYGFIPREALWKHNHPVLYDADVKDGIYTVKAALVGNFGSYSIYGRRAPVYNQIHEEIGEADILVTWDLNLKLLKNQFTFPEVVMAFNPTCENQPLYSYSGNSLRVVATNDYRQAILDNLDLFARVELTFELVEDSYIKMISCRFLKD